jgi:hypothetical protein
MDKYGRFHQKTRGKKRLNPIWRGIGCLLIVAVPVVAYGLMDFAIPLIIATGKVPYQLLGRVYFPNWTLKIPVLWNVTSFISSVDNLWLKIITFIVIMLLLTGVSSLLYSMAYAIVGPARYSAVDAPPTKGKVKKYTR